MTAIEEPLPRPTLPEQAQLSGLRFWKRLRGTPRITFGGGIVLLVLSICLLTLFWTLPREATLYFNRQNDVAHAAPSRHIQFWFGTDEQGRSIFARCLLGGAISLTIGIASAAIAVTLGVSVGLIAGYRGGWVDALLMRCVDILYGLPYMLLIILFKVAFSDANAVVLLFVAIGAVSWLTMARVVRGQVLSLRSQAFIEAARAAGINELRIFIRHLLPNLIGPIIIYATLIVPQSILQESFLSFLGIGVNRPVPSWGSLAADGLQPALNSIDSEWWMLLFPCALLAITLLGLNFLGDGLRDLFDPRREAAKV